MACTCSCHETLCGWRWRMENGDWRMGMGVTI